MKSRTDPKEAQYSSLIGKKPSMMSQMGQREKISRKMEGPTVSKPAERSSK